MNLPDPWIIEKIIDQEKEKNKDTLVPLYIESPDYYDKDYKDNKADKEKKQTSVIIIEFAT